MLKTKYKLLIFLLLAIPCFLYAARFGEEIKRDEIRLFDYIEKLQGDQPEEGMASYYDYDLRREDQKCLPENFPCYSQVAETCASRDYPKGTQLKVSRQVEEPWYDDEGVLRAKIGKTLSVVCKVNDTGPLSCEDRIKYGYDTEESCVERIIDLSSYAFKKLGDTREGLIKVKVEEYVSEEL